MKCIWLRVLFLGVVVAVGSGSVRAEEPSAEVIARIKQATAFVEKKDGFASGSAFCISPQGYFVTCAHVVQPLKIRDTLNLAINSGLPDQKTLEATIVRLAADRDIAILKVDAEKMPFLKLGDSAKLKETEQILVAGFPLGRGLDADAQLPAVTLSTGRVTAIRREEEFVSEIQIDAQLNPGNSGGPILDLNGNVVGVAASRIFLTELNFGISTFWVNTVMGSPLISLESVPPLPGDDEVFKLPFSVSYLTTPDEFGVSVSVIGAVTGEQELDVKKLGGGKFVGYGVAKAGSLENLSATLRADVIQENGNFTHTRHLSVLDQLVDVAGKQMRLSEVAAVIPKRNEVINDEGESISGALAGVSKVRASGANQGTVDLSRGYDALLIRPETAVPEEVKVSIRVSSGGMTKTLTLPVVREDAGRFRSYPPRRQKAFAYDEDSPFEGEEQVLDLEAELVDIAWGGGGRYAVLRMVRESDLLVIDCLEGREIGRIPFEEKGGSFTAGAERILLARGGEVEQWSFDPFKQLSAPKRWVLGEIDHIAMGPAWTGRAAVSYRAFGNERLRRLDFREPESSAVLAINPQGKMDDEISSLVPTLLETVLSIRVRNRPQKPIIWDEKGVRYGDDPKGMPCLFGPLGDRAVPPTGVHVEKGQAWVPTAVPEMGIRMSQGSEKETRVDLMDLRNGRELVGSVITLPDMGLLASSGNSTPSNMALAERVMVVPQLGLFACVPEGNRQLVIKPFDPWSAIESAGSDVVFASLLPPPSIPQGEVVRLDLQPRGSNKIQAKLESGPKGATVSSDGMIEWNVPTASAGVEPFIVRLTTEGGAEAFWKWEPTLR